VASSGNAGPLNVNVTDGSDIVCTITNTRKPGRLEVVKDVVPDSDPGKFNLIIKNSLGGTIDFAGSVGDNGTTGENALTAGTYQVSETDGFNTSLSDYTSSISCRGNNGTGSVVASSGNTGPLNVNVTDGSDIVCTITNTKKTAARLWGVDEDDDELFSIVDYTKIASGPAAAGLVSYGRLMYVKDGSGTLAPIGDNIQSFAIDSNGDAYMALDDPLDRSGSLSDLAAPVLVKFNVSNATTSGPNVVTVIGSIPIAGFAAGGRADNISGLAFQPGTGALYALYRINNAGRDPDRLLIISKTNASVISDLGQIQNTSLSRICDECEEIEFDHFGNLYASDDQDDDLYKVNPSNAQIIANSDKNERGGTGLHSVKIEALAWDRLAGKFVSFDDDNNEFISLTLGNGSNPLLGSLSGLTDVEGLDFYPSATASGTIESMVGERASAVPVAVTDLILSQQAHASASARGGDLTRTVANTDGLKHDKLPPFTVGSLGRSPFVGAGRSLTAALEVDLRRPARLKSAALDTLLEEDLIQSEFNPWLA
jgi:hypothetical protein